MAEISTFRTYVEEVPEHECGLDIRNVVEEALYGGMYPTRNQRFKKTFQRWCLVSRKHPYANRFFKSTASIGKEITRHAKCCPTIIHPFSIFRSNWEIFMIFIHSAAFVIFPFILSFPKTTSGEFQYIDPETGQITDYDLLDEEELANKRQRRYLEVVNWDYVLMGFGILTLIDMVVNFSTGYVRKDTREIVLKRKNILGRYLSTYFFIDLIPIIPYGYVWRAHSDLTALEYQAGEFFILLRIVRIYSVHQYFMQAAERFRFSSIAKRVIAAVYCCALTIHWCACINFMVDILIPGHRSKSYMSWSSLQRVRANLSFEAMWRASVFRTVKIICTLPSEEQSEFFADQDIVINLLTNIAGMILLYYLAAQIVISTRTANSAKARYEELQVQLSEYVKYKQVPLELEKRLVEFYRYCFRQNFYREPAILEFLSGQLRQEVLLHSCRRLVEIVPFFFNVPPNLMIRVVTCLVREVVLSNDVVMKAGLPGDSMYFISSGSVAVYTSTGSEMCHLKEGAHFGEIALVIEEETRTASVVALETTELYSLSRQDFLYAVAPDPELLASIRRTALKRLWHIGEAGHVRKKRHSRTTKAPAWERTPSATNGEIDKIRHRSADGPPKITRLVSVMSVNPSPPQNAEESRARWRSLERSSR